MWSVEVRVVGRFSFGRRSMGDRSRTHFPFVKHGLSFLDLGLQCPCGAVGFPLRVECKGGDRGSFLL